MAESDEKLTSQEEATKLDARQRAKEAAARIVRGESEFQKPTQPAVIEVWSENDGAGVEYRVDLAQLPSPLFEPNAWIASLKAKTPPGEKYVEVLDGSGKVSRVVEA